MIEIQTWLNDAIFLFFQYKFQKRNLKNFYFINIKYDVIITQALLSGYGDELSYTTLRWKEVKWLFSVSFVSFLSQSDPDWESYILYLASIISFPLRIFRLPLINWSVKYITLLHSLRTINYGINLTECAFLPKYYETASAYSMRE